MLLHYLILQYLTMIWQFQIPFQYLIRPSNPLVTSLNLTYLYRTNLLNESLRNQADQLHFLYIHQFHIITTCKRRNLTFIHLFIMNNRKFYIINGKFKKNSASIYHSFFYILQIYGVNQHGFWATQINLCFFCSSIFCMYDVLWTIYCLYFWSFELLLQVLLHGLYIGFLITSGPCISIFVQWTSFIVARIFVLLINDIPRILVSLFHSQLSLGYFSVEMLALPLL